MRGDTSNSTPPAPEDITQLLSASSSGSSDARDQLLNLVYSELHVLARSNMRRERTDHTLSATALVNEAYLRLFKATGTDELSPMEWVNRKTFYSAAATVMRRVLVDHARVNATDKRGGPRRDRGQRVALDVLEAANTLDPQEILALDEAISRLESLDGRAATVVRLRFYGGLENAHVAQMLDVSERTVKRDWEFARAWLRETLAEWHEQDENA
jgi:RNA polymerase sigma factor (TIGR02999 family)